MDEKGAAFYTWQEAGVVGLTNSETENNPPDGLNAKAANEKRVVAATSQAGSLPDKGRSSPEVSLSVAFLHPK